MSGDAGLAAALFAANPAGFGGMWLKGAGPERDAIVAWVSERVAGPVRRLPIAVDAERLLGGIDVATSLARGMTVTMPGLLDELDGGVLVVPMAERIDEGVAAIIAAREGRFGVLLLDDGAGEDERPPAALVERAAFHLGVDRFEAVSDPIAFDADIPTEMAEALAGASIAFGVDSVRALRFAALAARGIASGMEADAVDEAALVAAIGLVLGPRATRMPAPPEAEVPPPDPGDAPTQSEGEVQAIEDRVVEAVRALLPEDLDPAVRRGRRKMPPRQGGRGDKRRSFARGRPRGSVPGLPRGGARLALIDTLRAAVPWQPLRRAETGRDGLQLRKADLRVRRFEERLGTVTIFAVDASGSSAAQRLAEAKGAVELLLERAHVTRAQVALIAFRGEGAEVLLPPTKSLTRVRRALAALPGGGGTPLAAGIDAARALADGVVAKGQTPFVVLLTDGRANLTADGVADRARAAGEADAAANRLALAGIACAVIDISPRPQPEAARIASAMAARYVPLPRADAGRLARVIAGAA